MINQLVAKEKQFILIVEKEDLYHKIITDALEKDNVQVVFAPDAETAFQTIIAQRPSLILVNLEMPKLNACTFSRILKNDPHTSDIRIVAFSSNNPGTEQSGYCSFDQFLYSDRNIGQFAGQIRKILKTN